MKHRILPRLLAVACIALAALLCASALSIQREGAARRAEQPMQSIYTPQIVAQRLAPIAPLFFITVGLAIAGLLTGAEAAKKPRGAAAIAPMRSAPPKRQGLVRGVAIAAAVALILAGIFNASARDVFYKAISLCTECVGLG